MKPKITNYVLVLILLVISAVAHGYNMTHFPYYENDEGTYMSQAWSLLTRGTLAPYTYWYDHAPGGWVFIALWAKLTGGFFTFGNAVNAGRVLMLVVHLVSAILLYNIARKLGKGVIAGTIAVLVFSLSPTAIYFQRRVLLDNIMIFWILLSLNYLLVDKLKLRYIIVSAVSFGIAVLTKENAIFLLPAFLYTIYLKSHRSHKHFAFIEWLSVSGSVVSLYILYALLKREFFPPTLGREHVSLISTLQFQFGRGNNLPFWDQNSDFLTTLRGLYLGDPFTVIAGILATLISLILGLKATSLRISAFFAVVFWLFLARGKLIMNFYIVPLIPLIALNIGIIFEVITEWIGPRKRYLNYLLAILGIFVAVLFPLTTSFRHFIKDETTAQTEAVEWIRANLPDDAYIIIDNYAYLDLKRDGKFENSDWYFKLQYDPEIQKKYGENLEKAEYILLSHNMLSDFAAVPDNIVKPIFDNSYLVKKWTDNTSSFINLKEYKSTNGDWAMIYKVRNETETMLYNNWRYYKNNFIHRYGQVIDPQTGNTTSEGQSYALLRAVWVDDQETFDGVFAWAKDHLQHRVTDKLFSWNWINSSSEGQLGDSATAADADVDIALALLFAHKKWGGEKYLAEATTLIRNIWIHEVVEIDGRYYLLSRADASQNNGYLINPSYLSPGAFRIFAKVDPHNDWGTLADDSYYLLNNTPLLPPDWVFVDGETGELVLPAEGQNYGFDAFRTMCRVAQDYLWHGSREAFEYLDGIESFFTEEVAKGGVKAVYSTGGSPQVDYETISTSTGVLCNLIVTNPFLAEKFYESKNWIASNNYYDQNWSWFGMAMYSKNMPNLWK